MRFTSLARVLGRITVTCCCWLLLAPFNSITCQYVFQDWTTQPYRGQDKSIQGSYNYSQYQPFPKIVKELKRLEKQHEDDDELDMEVFKIGKTFEKRTIWAVKVKENSDKKKKMIVLDCGAHAREWIAPATCMYIINELTSKGTSFRNVLKKYDWTLIPSLNPDGYAYTWKGKNKRMWRKNRSYTKDQKRRLEETGNELCIGVDINRNFDKVWGGPGAPTEDPCYEMYAGSKPFSEKESSALAEYLKSVESDLIAYVSLHCYGQHWMTPWGFTSAKPKQYKEMKRVAKIAVKKMKDFSGVKYTIGPSHDELYPNSGSSVDWAFAKLSTPYTFLIEMKPSLDVPSSFMLPPSMMVKNVKDIAVGLIAMSENLKEGKTNL